MTFATLYNAVISRTGRTDKTQFAKDLINLNIAEITNRHVWNALKVNADLTININDLQTTLPSDYFKLIEARVINPTAFALSYPLVVLPKLSFVQRWADVSALGSGRPFAAYEENGVVYYAPKSSQVYTLRVTYLSKHPTLVSDGDTTLITTADAALIALATSDMFASIQNFEAAQYWRASGEQSLAEAYRNDQRRPGTRIQLQKFQQNDMNVENNSSSLEPWNDPFAGH